MHKPIYLFLICILSFTSCIQDWDEWLKTNDIEFKRTADSKYFSKNYADFKITKQKNDLLINFRWERPSNFVFPADTKTKDTLTISEFKYIFYDNGKIISNNIYHIASADYDWKIDSTKLIFCSKAQNLKYGFNYSLKIPLYYFHSLKKGKHELKLEIRQDQFFLNETKNKADSLKYEPSRDISLIKGNLIFKLSIPEIYQTSIFCNGLELQYDSIWSPYGMDFSIFTPGYPDIYWELFYPVNSNNDLSHPYYHTSVKYSAIKRLDKDTVQLYHYYPNEKIILGVYDSDVLSRDDFLGDWCGSLNLLTLKSENYKKIKFDHVDGFNVKIKQKGIINN